ncbi:MAG: glycosyltransferase [Paenibacillaceae bacterium]
MKRYVLHLITSHVSNYYMYNQIVGIKGYLPVVNGGYFLKDLPFKRFFPRKDPSKDLKRMRKKYPIALIHAQFGGLGAQAVPFAKRYDLPLITHFRGGDGSNDPAVREKFQKEYKLLATEGKLFLPVCRAFIPMLEDLGLPNKKIKVLYGGIDVDQFSFKEREFDTNGKFRICFVGKTSPKKGLPDLVDAFHRLNKEFEKLELRLISSTPRNHIDREEYKKIQALIHKYDLEDKVVFRFDVNNKDLHEELHRAHLFCHPSATVNGNIEGIPNALKEAMATGLPSVSTNHAGIPELINNNYNGLLVPENNPHALAYALAKLREDSNLCNIFAVRAREMIEERFNLKKQLASQQKIYNSLF